MKNPFETFGSLLASSRGQAHKLFACWNWGGFAVTFDGLLQCAHALNEHVFANAFEVLPFGAPRQTAKPAVFVSLRLPPGKSNIVGLCRSRADLGYAEVYVKSTLSPRNSLNTLAHEMVHAHVKLVQRSQEPDGHGVDFFAWAPVLKKFQIVLTKTEVTETLGCVVGSPHYLVYDTGLGFPRAWGKTRNGVLAETWAGYAANHTTDVHIGVVTKVEEKVKRLTRHPGDQRARPLDIAQAPRLSRSARPRVFLFCHKAANGFVRPLYARPLAHWIQDYAAGAPTNAVYSIDKKFARYNKDGQAEIPIFSESGSLETVLSDPTTIDLLAESWSGDFCSSV